MTSERVLLIDDREENLLALSSLLDGEDLTIDTATSGNAGLKLMLRRDYAVVLLDVQMPGMDGFEVARLMRASRRTKEVPIIFVTAFSRTEKNVFEGYDAGAVDYLFKPLQPQVVRSKVRVFIDLHRQRRQLASLNRDLESRVRARTAELVAERARYQALVELLPAVLYAKEPPPGDAFQFVSPRVSDLLGVEADTLLTDAGAWDAQIHPDDRDLVRAGREVVQSGAWRGEYRMLRSDGDVVWVRDEARLVGEDDQRAVRGLLLDITEQRMMREQMDRSQRLESIGALSGGLAHDFNNLLGVILGFAAEASSRASDDAELAHALDQVQRAAERGASITRRLLGFARQQTVRLQPLPVDAELERVGTLLRRLLPDDVEVVVDVEQSDLWVRVDPVHLEQVLLNLSINARDAMPDGGRLVISGRARALPGPRVTATGALEAGDFVEIVVTDNGAGMGPDTLRRIFEPFFTTKAEGVGSGLGLASSVGIVQQFGGAIEVESALHVGSSFRVFLPRSAPGSRSAPQAPPAAPGDGGGRSLLVVEDDLGIREMLASALSRHGFVTHSAGSGPEALALLEGGLSVDAVITDMTMPLMSGAELIHALRGLGIRVPVLIFSGLSEPAGVAELRGVRFLQKPTRPAAIARALSEMLQEEPG